MSVKSTRHRRARRPVVRHIPHVLGPEHVFTLEDLASTDRRNVGYKFNVFTMRTTSDRERRSWHIINAIYRSLFLNEFKYFLGAPALHSAPSASYPALHVTDEHITQRPLFRTPLKPRTTCRRELVSLFLFVAVWANKKADKEGNLCSSIVQKKAKTYYFTTPYLL